MKKSKVIFFATLFLTNIFCSKIFITEISFQEIFNIHVFLFSLMLLTDLFQQKISTKKRVITYSLISNFIRIFLCIVFLFPIIFGYTKSNNIYIYNFFIMYFIYLFYSLKFQQKKEHKINV